MRTEGTVYTDLEISDGHRYFESFSYEKQLEKLVTFSPNMKLPFHRWYYYKPGFSCKLIAYIKDRYLPNATGLDIYDPFCGVGTTPHWAYENGHNGIGSDISPLALFISECKSIRKIDKKKLLADLDLVIKKAEDTRNHDPQYELNEIPYYIQKGFDEQNREKLIRYMGGVNSISAEDDKHILLLALMKAAYDVSITKKDGGFLRYIDKPRFENIGERLKFHTADMLKDFTTQSKIFERESSPLGKEPIFHLMDSRKVTLPSDSVDLVVTSPPYLNRYDYTRIYAIEMGILGLSDVQVKGIRKQTIKSHVEADYTECPQMKSSLFDEAYNILLKSDLNNPQIPEMVKGYYHDLACTLVQLKRVTKEGGIVSFVVGNSRFSGIHLETDSILAEIGENLGFKLIEILVTKFRGSSAQQIQKYGDTQLRESIVSLRKDS